MSLTQDDLAAVQHVAQTTVQDVVQAAMPGAVETTVRHVVQPLIDTLAQDTDAGFAEVPEKFAKIDRRFVRMDAKIDDLSHGLADVQATVDRIERVQQAEAERVDGHGRRIMVLEQNFA